MLRDFSDIQYDWNYISNYIRWAHYTKFHVCILLSVAAIVFLYRRHVENPLFCFLRLWETWRSYKKTEVDIFLPNLSNSRMYFQSATVMLGSMLLRYTGIDHRPNMYRMQALGVTARTTRYEINYRVISRTRLSFYSTHKKHGDFSNSEIRP